MLNRDCTLGGAFLTESSGTIYMSLIIKAICPEAMRWDVIIVRYIVTLKARAVPACETRRE